MNKLITLLLLTSYSVFAQFGVINDPDGYVNVRSKPEKGNNINAKLKNGDVVYFFENEGNWTAIDFYNDTKDVSGYIYSDRIKSISDYKNIPIVSSQSKNAILQSGEIKITLTEKEFDPKKHKIGYLKDTPLVTSIDGKPVYGKDGDMPTQEYNSVIIEFGAQKIILPKEALANLFEPTLEYTIANYDSKNDILYIQSANSDGSGGYIIIWTIKNKKYFGRNIGFGF